MNILEGQILQSMAYVMLFHAEITNGYYKARKVERGVCKGEDGNTVYRPLTEAEKLKDHINTMESHIQRIGTLADMLPRSQE